MKGDGAGSALAAVATLAAAFPLTTLFQGNGWIGTTVVLLALLGLVATLLRRASAPSWVVVGASLLTLVEVVFLQFAGESLAYLVPTPTAARELAALVVEGVQTVVGNAAPVPDNRGIALGITLLVAALAVVVDAVAVTRRAPAAAGLVLLALFLVSSANSGSALPVLYFAFAACAWLTLLGRQSRAVVRSWSTTLATTSTPTSYGDATEEALGGLSRTASRLMISGIGLAVMLSLLLPHLPTRFLLEGLGRNPGGVGGSGTVGLSTSLDVGRSLRAPGDGIVLRYRTDLATPPPLRVVATSSYRNGEWHTEPGLFVPGLVPTLGSVSRGIERTTHSIQFFENHISPPNLALPYPMTMLSVPAGSYASRVETGDVYTDDDLWLGEYSGTYVTLEPTREQLRSPGAGDSPVADPLALVPDPASETAVSELAEQVTTGTTTRYDAALAIQEYLRSTGGFVYSLDLGEQPAGLDPIRAFLRTKRGYCVQFSSAMILMARAQGIPARMAIGFLPGARQRGGDFIVRSADAHSWPELWFPQTGWTRFEPTPASRTGAAPVWSLRANSPENATSSTATATRRDNDPEGRTTSPSAAPTTVASRGGMDLSPRAVWTAVTTWLRSGPHLALLGVLLTLLAAFVMPLTARWAHRRQRAGAATQAELVETEWAELAGRCADLGLDPPPSGTPREWSGYLLSEAHLTGPARAAMSRLAETVEHARYAPPASHGLALVQTLDEDASTVRRAIASSRAGRVRVRAALWPSAAVTYWREQGRGMKGRLGWLAQRVRAALTRRPR